MRKQARLLLGVSIVCVSSIVSFGCGGGAPDPANSALTSDGTPPLVCEAGWDHPIQCEIVRPDGVKEGFGGSGDRFHACEPGQTTRVDENTCCQKGVANPPCVWNTPSSGSPQVPVAGATVCVGQDEALCLTKSSICTAQYANGVYAGCTQAAH